MERAVRCAAALAPPASTLRAADSQGPHSGEADGFRPAAGACWFGSGDGGGRGLLRRCSQCIPLGRGGGGGARFRACSAVGYSHNLWLNLLERAARPLLRLRLPGRRIERVRVEGPGLLLLPCWLWLDQRELGFRVPSLCPLDVLLSDVVRFYVVIML